MKELLRRAWLKKFLQLTSIYIQPKPQFQPIYMYYQPLILHETYLEQNLTIFPVKLKDTKGYKYTIVDEVNQSKNRVAFEESR